MAPKKRPRAPVRQRTHTELLRVTAELEASIERMREDADRNAIAKEANNRAHHAALHMANSALGLLEKAESMRKIAIRMEELGELDEANVTFRLAQTLKENAAKTRAEALILVERTKAPGNNVSSPRMQ